MELKFITADSKKIYKHYDDIKNGTFVWCHNTKRFYLKMNDELTAITPARKPTQLHCHSCGAPLPEPSVHSAFIKCEYCGTIQDVDIW